MRVRNALCAAAMVVFMLATQLPAGVINYVGYVTGQEATNWRTPTVSKTMDISGDNVYGSLGAVNWKNGAVGIQKEDQTILGWNTGGAGWEVGSEYSKSSYVAFDKFDPALGTVATGIVAGGVNDVASVTFVLTGTAADYAGKTVRVGVMQDNIEASSAAGDIYKGLQIVQIDGSGDSGVISVRGGAAGDHSPEWHFFDLKDATAGDKFTIIASKNVGGDTGEQSMYLGPVAWDIGVVPEPSSSALLAASLVVWLAYAWRKRK